MQIIWEDNQRKMEQHLLETNFFHDAQHGFGTKRICLPNLQETLDDWVPAIDEETHMESILIYKKPLMQSLVKDFNTNCTKLGNKLQGMILHEVY